MGFAELRGNSSFIVGWSQFAIDCCGYVVVALAKVSFCFYQFNVLFLHGLVDRRPEDLEFGEDENTVLGRSTWAVPR